MAIGLYCLGRNLEVKLSTPVCLMLQDTVKLLKVAVPFFVSPPTLQRGFHCSTFSTIFSIVHLSNISYSSGHVVVSQFGFNFNFPDE